MTDVIKSLGQLAPAATTVTTLYTAPNLTQTTVSSLVVCNRDGSAATFRVSFHVAGASADDKQYLFYDKAISGNETITVVIGMCFAQTDVIKVYASTTNLSFNLFGVETS
jgi:hypothetical protein|tara:strand:+ start:1034 stop:1363 length:330 start_codon:yes stop_codon:yes gene_type:complete